MTVLPILFVRKPKFESCTASIEARNACSLRLLWLLEYVFDPVIKEAFCFIFVDVPNNVLSVDAQADAQGEVFPPHAEIC